MVIPLQKIAKYETLWGTFNCAIKKIILLLHRSLVFAARIGDQEVSQQQKQSACSSIPPSTTGGAANRCRCHTGNAPLPVWPDQLETIQLQVSQDWVHSTMFWFGPTSAKAATHFYSERCYIYIYKAKKFCSVFGFLSTSFHPQLLVDFRPPGGTIVANN